VQPGDDATFYPGVPPADYTLRDAIDLSNMTSGPNVVDFDITDAPPTIDLLGPIQINTPVVIDGSTQPGYNGTPVVELNGVVAGVNDAIEIDGDQTTVRDLAIVDFPGTGVVIYGNDNTVQGNFIGVDPSGTTADGNLANQVDVLGASNTVGGTTAAERNIIAGTPTTDVPTVTIDGAGATNNVIEGNYIGTDVTGKTVVGDAGTAVYLTGGAANNTIGGTSAGAGNLISGNAYPATAQSSAFATVQIDGQGTNGNVVAGNLIGTDVSGAKALGNGGVGVYVDGGAAGNTIGGTTAAARNVISGNGSDGIDIVTGATKTVVEGNYIGTNAKGTAALPNSGIDVLIEGPANTIGGTTAAQRNIIAGTSSTLNAAITVATTSATKNVIEGNYIGTDVTGQKVVGNAGIAIYLTQGVASNTIGGTATGAGNLISGNASPFTVQSQGLAAVVIYGTGTNANVIAGNLVGTDAKGASALGNGGAGIDIGGGATGNTIGGSTAAAANLISGNQGDGIYLTDAATSENVILGNLIGSSADGSESLANMGNGIAIIDASDNTIGGTSAAAANVIGYNGEQVGVAVATGRVGETTLGFSPDTSSAPIANGVFVRGKAAGNVVKGNYIGITKSGQSAGNSGNGVVIEGASNNTIGGTATGARNIISANAGAGVLIIGGTDGTTASGNMVQGNDIGTNTSGQPSSPDSTGFSSFGNTNGVVIEGGASNNTIGATTSGSSIGGTVTQDPASNIIAGNNHDGVIVVASATASATGNRISQNQIYADANMGIDLGNDGITAPNDNVGSASASPNNWQSYPVIYDIETPSSGPSTISFFVPVPGTTSAPNSTGMAGTTYTVEFYANSAANAAGLSEGQQFLGSATALGNQLVTMPFTPTTYGTTYITGITIDSNGNTSEFSPVRDLLRNSVGNFALTPKPRTNAPSIAAFFQPKIGSTAMTLARAAQICDVDHFNWTQTITGLPPGQSYFIYQGTWNTSISATGHPFWPPPPAPTTPANGTRYDLPIAPGHYGVSSPTAAAVDPDNFPTGVMAVSPYPNDIYTYYTNEDAVSLGKTYGNYVPGANPISFVATNNASTAMAQIFYDAPILPQPFNPTLAYKSFETQLTGVFGDPNHSGVIWGGIPNTNFHWQSNAVYNPKAPGVVQGQILYGYDSVPIGAATPTASAGGVSGVQYDVGGPVDPTPSLVVSGSGTVGGTGALSATLTLNGSPLAGQTVIFSLTNGMAAAGVGSATTNSTGVATLSDVSLNGFAAGVYSGAVGATFAANATYTGTIASGDLTVNPVSGTIKPPVLASIPDQSVDVGAALQLNVGSYASDPNTPALPLTYSLGAAAPSGVAISPTMGVLTWHVGANQRIGTYQIPVQVSDNSSPALSVSEMVKVNVVDPGPAPRVAMATATTKKGFITITIRFSEPVNPATAANSNNYVLTAPAKKPSSNQKPTPPPTRIGLNVSYNQSTRTVTLTALQKPPTSAPLTLTVIGSSPNGIAKLDGLFLAGVGGKSGTSYVALVTQSAVTTTAAVAGRTIIDVTPLRSATVHAPFSAVATPNIVREMKSSADSVHVVSSRPGGPMALVRKRSPRELVLVRVP